MKNELFIDRSFNEEDKRQSRAVPACCLSGCTLQYVVRSRHNEQNPGLSSGPLWKTPLPWPCREAKQQGWMKDERRAGTN